MFDSLDKYFEQSNSFSSLSCKLGDFEKDAVFVDFKNFTLKNKQKWHVFQTMTARLRHFVTSAGKQTTIIEPMAMIKTTHHKHHSIILIGLPTDLTAKLKHRRKYT
jgi:hypothetical protein